MKFRLWMGKRIHISWQIFGVCIGILGGIGLSLVPSTAVFAQIWWLVVAGLTLVSVFAKSKRWMFILALTAGLIIGMFRGTIERVDLNSYDGLIGQNVTLTGKVFEDPDIEPGGLIKMRIIDGHIDDRNLNGQIFVSTIGFKGEVKRSDIVKVEGVLKSGFGTFPASMSYVKVVKVESGTDDPAREMRDEFGEHLENAITQPAESLGMGILAGQKTALPSDVSDAFRIAGLTHIVVASGYNLTILIRFARRSFAKISRLAALLGGGGMAFAFACVTGFSPSMMRAVMVAGLSLLAWYYGRKFHPLALIFLVAATTALMNPFYVWGDAGWYMSFFAFAGVLILAPLIHAYFWDDDEEKKTEEKKKPAKKRKSFAEIAKDFGVRLKTGFSSIRQIFVETMSAQILTMPIIALMLGQFAPYGLLANLLVLPIVPLTMLLTFVAGVVTWIVSALGPIVGWPAQQLLDYIIWVSKEVSSLPMASQEIDLGVVGFVIAMAVIVGAIIYMQRRTKHSFREDNVIE